MQPGQLIVTQAHCDPQLAPADNPINKRLPIVHSIAHGTIVPQCTLIFRPSFPTPAPTASPSTFPSPPASAYPSIRLFSNQHSISGCRELKSQANNMTRRPSMNSNRQSNQFCPFTAAAASTPAAATAVAAASASEQQ